MLAIYRGSTISLIYNQSLRYPAKDSDLPAVTLMSSDVDQLSSAIMFGSNIWANLVTISIGIWLVWRQLGPIALAPILVAVVCSGGSVWIGKAQGRYRGIWIQALQRRIGFTSRNLGNMKGIKMTGMSECAAGLLQGERTRELEMQRDFRWSNVLQNSIGEYDNKLQQGGCVAYL
jgi:ATP-binding cassette subfamily C (CFTR/MRP) protein 1